MGKSVITQFQPSITEWFADVGETSAADAFRKEDNGKVDRLEILYQTIGLPYERPEKLEARELTDLTPRFKKILEERGEELCAIRLVPKKDNLPKIRNRGLSIRQCYETWYLKQNIDPDDYFAFICPHAETLLWATIFVIRPEMIFGEIIRGKASQLTHGDTTERLLQFRYDFKKWQWSQPDAKAEQEIQRIINILLVKDKEKQSQLTESLQATFSHEYLSGYFEATVWPDDQPYIIDYNRVLPDYIPVPPSLVQHTGKNTDTLSGIAASPGIAKGIVRVVAPEEINTVDFPTGSILVCGNTDVRYLPLMKKAGAIVTDHGGILSHAAIISRELHIPCLVDTKNATEKLRNGDQVTVDATQGIITKT